ncbi:hypothetical protein BCV72DRAFT_315122, partial [Rhizopus microsporus var. microsporus]
TWIQTFVYATLISFFKPYQRVLKNTQRTLLKKESKLTPHIAEDCKTVTIKTC